MALTTAWLTYSQFCLQSQELSVLLRPMFRLFLLFSCLTLSGCFVRSKIFGYQSIWMPFLWWTCIFNSYNLIVLNSIYKIIKEWSVNNFLVCFKFISVVVQSLSRVWLFVTPWTVACQFSLSFTISWRLLKLMSIELVMPSNHLVLFSSCHQSFPASGSFPMSWLFTPGGQSIGASALASALSMNIQDWFPLGLTGLISLQSKGISRVFSNTTV